MKKTVHFGFVRVGVIGLGVGEQFAHALHAHPECRLVAVSDVDPIKLANMAHNWPPARVYEDPFALIAADDIDLVCVASPDDCHHAQIMACLAAGKHVFSEKPLTINHMDTAEIHQALRARSDLRLSSNTLLRRSPRFLDLKHRIDTQQMGIIYHLEADYNYGRLWKLTEGWRGRIPNYSVILGGGVHLVDLVLWLKGSLPVSVSAMGTDMATRTTDYQGYDTVMALLSFADGTMAKIGANFGCVEPHFHRLLVYGTEASFENQRDAGVLFTSRDPDSVPQRIETAYPGVAKAALIPAFIEAILGRGDPVIDEDAVFQTMAVCHAINHSLQSGKKTPVIYSESLTERKINA